MKIWLDDLRNPQNFNHLDYSWILNPDTAILLIKTGEITHISFDHDLGENCKTGYDVAKEIEKLCFNKKIKCPIWKIHSANPVGRENIRMAMENAEKFSE